ncbi:MAG: MipA/OmpV family protein [Rhodobacter sp.]|nr:MipA/OmpV family protein [Rhodobacter sp.]
MWCISLAVSVLALTATATLAQEQPQGFSAGLGVAGGTSIYMGEDTTATALPILRYESDAFSVSLPEGLRVTLLDRDTFRLSAVASPRLSDIDASDAPELAGLDREITVDGGLQARYRFGRGTELRFRGVTELTDEHGGGEIGLSVAQALPLGRVPVFLGGGVTWQSEDLADYLYGVSATEATATRPAYSPGEVIIPYLSIGTAVPISDRTRFIANVRAEFLPEDVTDSPIVDEDVALRAFIGVSFSF